MPKLERLNVSKTDLANLSESGLKRDTIRANGLRTEGGALVFPYRDLDGNEDGFTRKRPHVPRVKDGREIKYEQPKGEACRAYFPAASLPMLRDGTSPIYVTEGEKKALALSQLGLASIGIGGVWCWKIKDTENLIPDLEAVAWQGRDVYIVFDHDEKPKTQRSVEYARQRLARALRASGAQEVYNVELPPGPDGGKMGVDDYIVWQGETAFSELVSASQPIPVGVRPMRVPAGRTDAANAARLIDRYGSEIRWVGPWDKWLLWDGQRWCIDDSRRIEHHGKEIANRLWKELGEDISKGDIVKEALTAMYAFAKSSNNAGGVRAMVSLAKSEPGVVVSPDKLDADPWLLNVENGTLDLRTGKLRDHRQEDFLTKLAPVTFDPAAECPLWLAFLDRIFAGNQELIGYLQRLAGYNLTGVTHEHILPFLFGDGSNGKAPHNPPSRAARPDVAQTTSKPADAPAIRRKGGQPGNVNSIQHGLSTNATRHGLRGGQLPKGCKYIEYAVNNLRRQMEEAVLTLRQEITILDAANINSILKWERHGLLAAHWLRHEAETLSASDRLKFSEAIAKASDNRDKAIRALGLDRDTKDNILDALYSKALPAPTSNGDTDEQA